MNGPDQAAHSVQNGNQYSPKQLWGAGLVVTLLIGLMSFGGVKLVLVAFGAGEMPWLWRGLILVFSAGVLFLPCLMLRGLGKRKLTTGRFLLGPAEARRKRAETVAKLGAGQPLKTQIVFWLLPLLFSAFSLAVSAAILISQSSWCDCEPRVKWSFYGLAGFFGIMGLIYPALCVWRKVKTGSFLLSNEKIRARMAKCGAPKPRWQRILVPSVFWLDAVLFTWSAIRKHPTSANAWMMAGLWCVAAVLWTLQSVRPAKAQCIWEEEERTKEQPVCGIGRN
jgi:hypothetical protein